MMSIESLILTILALTVIAIFCGSIYVFLRAIISFIFSKGDADTVKGIWNSMRFLVRGVILTIILLLFFPNLLRYMGIQSYHVFEAKNILDRAGELFQALLNFGKDLDLSGGSRGAGGGSNYSL